VIKENQHSKSLPSAEPNNALAGVSTGLTIPGPRDSFQSARIDVSVYLNHDGSTEGAREALKHCSQLVQEQLEAEAKEIREYFHSQ
jgi:hypothetical protein